MERLTYFDGGKWRLKIGASANWPRRTRRAFHRVHFADSILRQVVMGNHVVCAQQRPHYGGSRIKK